MLQLPQCPRIRTWCSICICPQRTDIPSLQERDGYSEQLVSLRDKISLLSRELAEGEEGGRAKGDLITKLESQLRAAQEDAAAAKTSSSAQIADLEAAVADTAAELEKTKRSLKQELARVTQVPALPCTPRVYGYCK